MTLVVVKRTEEEFADWLATEIGFLQGLVTYEDKPFRLEAYQRSFLENKARFRWVTKGRQVGFSLLMAIESLARCHLREGHNAIFVSYSLDDAKEKIAAAREIYEGLPLDYQKRIVIDSRTELAFVSNSRGRRVSRMLSNPSKAPRGKKGDVYLDELAHYINDREVYRGSTALILRAKGQLTGCSTPLGKRGVFWEIAEQELRPYPHHRRQAVPWWLCTFFCSDTKTAARTAAAMGTLERIERFGTPDVLQQFDSLPLEDFQQEFECSFAIDSYAYYPYELILPCTRDNLAMALDFRSVPKPKGRLVAGFDVGRVHDRSELAVFEENDGRFLARMLKSYHQVPFAEQEADLAHMLDVLPIVRFSIDCTGMGMQMAENLSRRFPQVVGEVFSNESKERWATDFKILLQKEAVILPRDRNLVTQIHSIKRKLLPSGKVGFHAPRGRQGHADRFWAIVLACQRERFARELPSISLRVIG